MNQLIMLVGPCGSGKSTKCLEYPNHVRVNQDAQGKAHLALFNNTLGTGCDIILDRMNFNKQQRDRYLIPAKQAGYTTKIIVLHESYDTCLERMLKREGHPTIQNETSARSALHTFFSKYERVQDSEADEVVRVWPEGSKPEVIIVDLDGTLCNIDHRLHFVRGDKKDWRGFLSNLDKDIPNEWCVHLLNAIKYGSTSHVIYMSGRGQEYKDKTVDWLRKHNLYGHCVKLDNNGIPVLTNLFMRCEKDSRPDTQIKEILLDFEVLTRYTPLFMIDDRPSVCRMWRSRGYTVLQCNDVEF